MVFSIKKNDEKYIFDSVRNDLMSLKLKQYGLEKTELDWFRSYLAFRFQKIVVEDDAATKHYSDWVAVGHGVPQGSILGPLLFLIYVIDLSDIEISGGRVLQFAEDTAFVVSNDNFAKLQRKPSKCITNLNKYVSVNGLELNLNKSKIMYFHPANKNYYMPVVTTTVKESNTERFLGVFIDEGMKWKSFETIKIPFKYCANCS